MVFAPLQAVRITTTDCFDLEILVERVDLPENPYKRNILEVIDSPWIELLKRELKHVTKMRHSWKKRITTYWIWTT